MLARLGDPEAERLLESLATSDEVEIQLFSKGRFEARVGLLKIRVLSAKTPHQPWDPTLHEMVLAARRSYWETWGQIPLDDRIDESSYVDVAWVSYPAGAESANGATPGDELLEGLTVRTVTINGTTGAGEAGLPDDLRFWIGTDGTPLFELMAARLYDGDLLRARRGIVIGSRLASIRSPEKRHHYFSPEAYAALQVVAAARAIQDGADYMVNTMRQEMTRNVLSLPDGTHFRHFGTEQLIGLMRGDIRLNRADPFVFEHMCRYPGYFTNTRDFLTLVERLAGPGGGLDPDRLRSLGLDLERLHEMKASELKVFSSLLTESGSVGDGPTVEALREKVRSEVGDGPCSFTTALRERLAQGIKILKQSPAARRLGSPPFSRNGHLVPRDPRQNGNSSHDGRQAGVAVPRQKPTDREAHPGA